MSLRPMDVCFSCNIGKCEECTGYTLMGHLCQHGCYIAIKFATPEKKRILSSLTVQRLGDPADSEIGPLLGYIYKDYKCLGSIHQTEKELVFDAGAIIGARNRSITPLNADTLEEITQILNCWVN